MRRVHAAAYFAKYPTRTATAVKPAPKRSSVPRTTTRSGDDTNLLFLQLWLLQQQQSHAFPFLHREEKKKTTDDASESQFNDSDASGDGGGSD